MQTTGPYALTIGTTLSEYDPGGSWQPQSTAVQVQNNSGYQLIISIGGQQYAINPFTQTTVLTANAALLQITPYNVLSNFGGSVTLVWLQAGESPPSPDGTLFAPNTNQGGLIPYGYGGGIGTTWNVWQPDPGPNSAYRIHSVVVSNSANTSFNLQIAQRVSATDYQLCYANIVAANGSRTDLLNGLLIGGAICVPSGAGPLPVIPGTMQFTFNYDLVQI